MSTAKASFTLPKLAPVVIAAAFQRIPALGHGKNLAQAESADFAIIGTVEMANQKPGDA